MKPWYYQSDLVGKVDFIVEGKNGKVVPIEVKSGKKVRAHAALDRLLDAHRHDIQEAIVLSRNNIMQENMVSYLPFYMTTCLDEFTERDTGDFTFAPALP